MRSARVRLAFVYSTLWLLALDPFGAPAQAAATSPFDAGAAGGAAPSSVGAAISNSMVEIIRAKAAGSMTLAASDTAYFAGGSFWALEAAFEGKRGVSAVSSGYVKRGKGPVETIEVVFDPRIVSYEMLLDHYWHNVDPTERDGQLCDKGPSYRAIIFVRTEGQRQAAISSREALTKHAAFERPIVTEIAVVRDFERAGSEDQDVYRRQRALYRDYLEGCHREKRLAEIWAGRPGNWTTAGE